jgi:hypothetical protein
MTLKMLKMRGHAIMAGLVRTDSSTALTTPLSSSRGKLKRLLDCDGHPTPTIPEFAIC